MLYCNLPEGYSKINPSTILGLILRLRSGQVPGFAFRQTFRQAQGRECTERLKAPSTAEGLSLPAGRQGLILSGAFAPVLKAEVWCRRSINKKERRVGATSACLREAAPAYAKPPLRRAQVGRRRQVALQKGGL
jgi:hypothetical protein